jgi:hypothetical protein
MTTEPLPRRPLSVLLVLGAATAVFLDYWEYSRSFHNEPDIWNSTLQGRTAAPEQYRMGVLKAADFLTHHSPLAMRHALALFDFIALLTAAFVLRSLLFRSRTWRSASIAAQWFGAAAFVLLLELSLAWLSWYQRPETLTIAALLALSLWLSTYRLPGPAGSILTALALILIALALGFIRADIAVTFNFGIALACLLPSLSQPPKSGWPIHHAASSRDEWGTSETQPAFSRWPQFFMSLAAALTAGATQLYVMHVLYPHATYGSSPVFELLLNYTDHIRIVPFVLFITPSAWAAWQVLRRRFTPSRPETGLLLGAALFTMLWCVLGKIDEVRIFLPFAFALAPLTVEAAMARIAPVENPAPSRNVS